MNDAGQALKDTENALRDFIAEVLESKFGAEWIHQCGVTANRLSEWQRKKEAEVKRQRSGTIEERLIYYADFYDLEPILKSHWSGEFTAALGELKTMQVWLDELGRLRDPDAHGRELLPHQMALAVGIAGEIRTRLIRYRSKMETAADCFPRIETVRDSVGNLYMHSGRTGLSKVSLRPGDVVDFVVTASDPFGDPLLYGMTLQPNHTGPTAWQAGHTFRWDVTAVAVGFSVCFWIKSPRKDQAQVGYDDLLMSTYDVLSAHSSV